MVICFRYLGRKEKHNAARSSNLAMQEFAPHVGPELVHQVHAGVAQQGKADARANRPHSLALPGNIKIRDGACSGDAENPRGVESLPAGIGAGDKNAAHGVQRALEKWQAGIAKISRVLPEQRGKEEALEKNICFSGGQVDAIGLAHAAKARLILPVEVMAFGAVGSLVNGGVGEGARRVGAAEKYIKFLARRERPPLAHRGVGFSVNRAGNLVLGQVLHHREPRC